MRGGGFASDGDPEAGRDGWPGYYGTAWCNDPVPAIFLVRRAHAGDQTRPMWLGAWTAAYPAIDD